MNAQCTWSTNYKSLRANARVHSFGRYCWFATNSQEYNEWLLHKVKWDYYSSTPRIRVKKKMIEIERVFGNCCWQDHHMLATKIKLPFARCRKMNLIVIFFYALFLCLTNVNRHHRALCFDLILSLTIINWFICVFCRLRRFLYSNFNHFVVAFLRKNMPKIANKSLRREKKQCRLWALSEDQKMK